MSEKVKVTKLTDGTTLKKLGGKYHCVKGPAIVWPCGKEFFHLDGVHYPEKEYWHELHNRGLITYNEMVVALI